jgi:hypothetical protein
MTDKETATIVVIVLAGVAFIVAGRPLEGIFCAILTVPLSIFLSITHLIEHGYHWMRLANRELDQATIRRNSKR